MEIRAGLVVAADGAIRGCGQRPGSRWKAFGSPRDVLWMKLSRQSDDPPYTMGHAGPGRASS